MKAFFLWGVLVLGACYCGAQNLVPNPSFEEYVSCPDNLSQISKAIGWNSARPSPDYFNVCVFSGDNVSIPENFFGYQYPASGNAYTGFAAMYGGVSNLREYLGIKLTDSLQVGSRYYVNLKISRAYNANFLNDCSVNKVGALFSTTAYSDTNNAPICNCPQVYTNLVISDSLNWTRINDSFIADSNYLYINIGNFFTNEFTDSIQNQGTFCNAYYYLDDICVSTDSQYCYNYSYTGVDDVNSSSSITIYPNPFTDYIMINKDGESIENIRVFNLTGQLVKNYHYESSNYTTLDLVDLPKGIYMLSIYGKNFTRFNQTITKL